MNIQQIYCDTTLKYGIFNNYFIIAERKKAFKEDTHADLQLFYRRALQNVIVGC